MKRTLNLLLVLRYPTSDSVQLVSSLERSLDSADAAGDLPIHWNYPVHPLLGDSSSRADRVVARLKARQNDRTLPVGYAGAHHALLQSDELRKELRWCSDNPWNEDLKTAFGAKGIDAFLPLSVDLSRARSRAVYSEGPKLLAVDATNEMLLELDGERVTSLPLVTTGRRKPRNLSKELLHRYRREPDDWVAVLVDAIAIGEAELTAIFEALCNLRERHGGFAIRTIDELPQPSPPSTNDLGSLALRVGGVPNDPISRAHRLLGTKKRRGRRRASNEVTKQRLERLAVVDPVEAGANLDRNGELRVDDRTLIADMSGIVTLSEAQQSVRFVGGRVAGMAHEQGSVVIERPACSYMQFGGRKREFATVSAFSFEGDQCRGLRTIQALDGEGVVRPGQVIGDYFFEDGEPDLLATITVSYPELREVDSVEEYALLEVPLFSTAPDDEIEMEAEYPDGERFTLRLRPQPAPFQLCGERFRFRSNTREFGLSILGLENAVPELLAARFRKIGRRFLFCISPRGSYLPVPAAAFTGIVERLRFAASVHPATREDGAPGGNAVPANRQK